MKFRETKIKGLYVIEPEIHFDKRGYFARIFCKQELSKIGINFNIAQVNRSLNKKQGIIRGMHFQKFPKDEDKIIQCLQGEIYDVAIDLRQDSATYGQWIGTRLSQENKKMFLIPKGFAHGFQTLTDSCEILYFMSEFYSPQYESGVRWNDPFFNIKWPIKNSVVSEKDQSWPLIKQRKR